MVAGATGLQNPMLWVRSIPGRRMMAVLLWLIATRGFSQLSRSTTPDDVVTEGVRALQDGNLEAAQRLLDQALQQGVNHPIVFHNLGVIAQERHNQKQAVIWFRKSLVVDPNYGPSRLLLGSSLLALGQNDAAMHELSRAVRLMPDEPAARLQLAKAYEATEKWMLAVEQLQKLATLAPQNAEYAYQLGKALTRLSGWSLQEISRVNPNAARLHQALGQEYSIQEKYDRALVAYQQAAKADPKLPEIHLGIALILLQMKRFDEALAEIEQELALSPDSKMAADAKNRIETAKAATN